MVKDIRKFSVKQIANAENINEEAGVKVSRRHLLAGAVVLGLIPASQETVAATTEKRPLADVAYSGSYEDLIGTPDLTEIKALFGDKVVAGQAGTSDNQELSQALKTVGGWTGHFSGSIEIPYFKVNTKGLITEYGTRTLTFK